MFSTLAPTAVPLRVPFARQLELAQANGFNALDLPVRHLLRKSRSESVDQIKESFAAAGLRCGGWQLPFDHQVGLRDYSAELRRLTRAASLAAELDSPWCYYWIEPFSDELNFADNTAKHVERLRPIAELLAEHRCRLALEPIGPRTLRAGHRFEFVHSIPMTLELLAAVDRPNVGLLVDCFHWYTSRGTAAELKGLAPAEVVYVHINDAPPEVDIDDQLDDVRLLPGASGVIDLVAFLRALAFIGYDGPVAVEPFDNVLAGLPPSERVRLAAESIRAAFDAAGLPQREPA
jgi:sugar phosphate isomerase/epimerase